MSTHDVLLVDLDGTVYRGPEPVAGAVEALEAARSRGVAISYVTNNASRSPAQVCEHLADLGLTLAEQDVVTSAQAAAAVLAQQCEPGDPVLVVGAQALADEIGAVGLVPVREAADAPVAVVQGHSPDTGWSHLAEAAVALAAGAVWVACNIDPTLPSERGFLPGNGAMVAALRVASRREPQVAGKPASPLLAQAVRRAGARHPLVVGDRLDTDIAGANALEAESLLVLTGVSTPAEVLAAAPTERPTHLAADLGALADLGTVRVGADPGWSVTFDAGPRGFVAGLSGSGEPLAGLRALCAAVWAHDGDPSAVTVRADGSAAQRVVEVHDLPAAPS